MRKNLKLSGVLITHNELRDFLAELGKELGYKTKTEYPLDNKRSPRRVDVVWFGDKTITFEVELSNTRERIKKNIAKCLTIADKHITVIANRDWLDDMGNTTASIIPILKRSFSRRDWLMMGYRDILMRLLVSNMSVEEQADKFKQETGLGRRSFFRYKREVWDHALKGLVDSKNG